MANKPATQDHKPKAVKAKETTGQFRLAEQYEYREVEGWNVDHDGLSLFVPRESLADYFVQENMAKMRSEGKAGGWRFPLVLERIFGEEQKAKIVEHVTDPATGRPDQERLGEFFELAMKAAVPNS